MDYKKKQHWDKYSPDYRKELVEKIYHWQYANSNSFDDIIFVLIAKASLNNLNKLALGFMDYIQVFVQWQDASDSGDDLFRQYQVGHFAHKTPEMP